MADTTTASSRVLTNDGVTSLELEALSSAWAKEVDGCDEMAKVFLWLCRLVGVWAD